MIRGPDADVVRRALDRNEPLPGAADRAGDSPHSAPSGENGPSPETPAVRGFAGALPDGRLVRDVLGRQPLYVDGDDWAFDPAKLADPTLVPAGSVRTDARVRSVWSLPDPDPLEDDPAAVGRLREALDAALADAPDCPVAFSGGVDSAMVASRSDGPLYAVGFPDSHDLDAARDAAAGFAAELRVVELDADALERAIPEVARAIGRTNAMDVGIAVPLYLAAKRAAADGHDRIAVGQGADELFGGYAKVAKAPDDPRVEADTVRGARREVLGTLPDQLPRDVLAMRAAGVEPVAPLLDDRVVAAALPLPGRLLVDDGGERKVALRRAARSFVPDRVAARDKKAVQYGSLVARELDRLARQAGFKRRMDDHVGQYVRHRLDEE